MTIKKIEKKVIKENQIDLIKEFSNRDYDHSDPKYPFSLCSTCRLALNERKNGNFKRNLVSMPNYSDIMLPKQTRSRDINKECYCYICLTGRYKGHKQTSNKGRGHNKEFIEINKNNGLQGAKSTLENL